MDGIRFITGLESEFMDGATPETDEAKFLPEAEDMESRDDSIDGNGSKSLSRLRLFSYGGGVNDLCKGEAAYECCGKGRCEEIGGSPGPADWKAGGSEDRFFTPEGADVTLESSGAIVGDRPACVWRISTGKRKVQN
jgi:hypothetical protein